MIRLDEFFEIFDLVMFGWRGALAFRFQLARGRAKRRDLVRVDRMVVPCPTDLSTLGASPPLRFGISRGIEIEIDCVPELLYGSEEMHPFSVDLVAGCIGPSLA